MSIKIFRFPNLKKHVYIPFNSSILVLVEEMNERLETQLLIQATQQDSIENALVFLSTQSN